jgi:hypothetical protein
MNEIVITSLVVWVSLVQRVSLTHTKYVLYLDLTLVYEVVEFHTKSVLCGCSESEPTSTVSNCVFF